MGAVLGMVSVAKLPDHTIYISRLRHGTHSGKELLVTHLFHGV